MGTPAFRPFVRPRGGSLAPRSTPHPRAGEMPGLDRRATPAFSPLARSWPEPCGRRGGGRPPGGAGRPAGVAPGLQAVTCSARGSRPDERAKHPGAPAGHPRHFARSAGHGRAEPRPGRRRRRAGGIPRCVHEATAAFRPLGWTRAGGAATGARPRPASGRSARVRPPGDRGISPARGDEAGAVGIGAAGGVKGDRLEARGGLPGLLRASRRSPAPRAARVPDERAERPGASAGRPRPFARSRIRSRIRRTERAGTGRHGPASAGGRSGTYGRHTGRE